MTQAVATRDVMPPPEAPAVTSDQLDLIKRTVAKDATADELRLYLYDCARQGVHPLDRLIHFTKRSGKYTPITSIDFMRIRAAETSEYAGSDDPDCQYSSEGHLELVRVTVWRLVQGQRCPFTATARWTEYKPEANDFMWRKMPHTMLGKCAEALALRKGFPRQLAGLYAKEEMDRNDEPKAGYSVQAPGSVDPPKVANGGEVAAIKRVDPNAQESSDIRPSGAEAALGGATSSPSGSTDDGPDLVPEDAELPAGYVLIRRVDVTDTRNKNVKRALLTVSTGETFSTINPKLATLAEQCAQNGTPVRITSKDSKYGDDLVTLETWKDTNAALDAEIVTREHLAADMARAAGEIL